MNIYISGRQFGKTTMLIKESARTGATIAVATYQMVKYVQGMAALMDLKIPEPVTYPEVFKTYRENKTKRYLVDELQMMLSQLNVDIATVDLEPIQYLNHWKYPDGYQLVRKEKTMFDLKKQKELEGLRDILIDSNSIRCENVAPEVVFAGQHSYLLHGYDQRVIVDFNKMARALYDAGYRKGECDP